MRWAVALVAAAVALLAAAPASADPFYGANVDGVWDYPAAQQPVLLDSLAASGLKIARFAVYWDAIEPQLGRFDWTETDHQMSEIAAAGMEPYAILDQSPSWDRAPPGTNPPSVQVTHYAPTDPAPFARFAAAFAQRYGEGGSYPTAATDPVRIYEIWNEENLNDFYYPSSATQYAALYTPAREAIRAVDPGANVVLGGIAAVWFQNGNTTGSISFTSMVLKALGYCPDSIGYHAYPLSDPGLLSAVASFRQTLDSGGCPATPIEVNEFDYVGSDDPASNFAEAAASLPAAGLGVDRLMPLPAVVSPADIGVPSQLLPLENPDGTLTPIGQAYASVATGSASSPAGAGAGPGAGPAAGPMPSGETPGGAGPATGARSRTGGRPLICRARLSARWTADRRAGSDAGAIECRRIGRGTLRDHFQIRFVRARFSHWQIRGRTAQSFARGVLLGHFTFTLAFARSRFSSFGDVSYHGGSGAFRRASGWAAVVCSGHVGRRSVRCTYGPVYLKH